MSYTANILLSRYEDSTNIYATTDGDTFDDALSGVEAIVNFFCADKLAYIRVAPEAHCECDFDTKIIRHRGFVRFTFWDKLGEWFYPEQDKILNLGGLEI